MKKRYIISALVLSFACFSNFSAFAEEQQRIGLGVAWDYGFGVTAQYNGNINATIGNEGFGLDYIFFNKDIKDVTKLTWFIAAGGGIHNLFDNNKYTALKARGLVGLDFNFAPDFDGYFALGPELKLYTDSDANDTVRFDLDAVLGIRYFF